MVRKNTNMISLTDREKEILKLISKGMTTKGISKFLFISESTVVTHRKNILKKLNAVNTPDLVRIAITNSLI